MCPEVCDDPLSIEWGFVGDQHLELKITEDEEEAIDNELFQRYCEDEP